VAKSFAVESIEKFSFKCFMAFKPEKTLTYRFSEFYFERISSLLISQYEIQIFLLFFDCFPTYNVPEVTVWFRCLRFRQRSIERVLDLTDSFAWEDLPTRDADTGHLTAAGWIPFAMKYSKIGAIVFLCVHAVQSTIRIVTNHETIVIVWYPIDWTVSPIYELVNISQVTIS